MGRGRSMRFRGVLGRRTPTFAQEQEAYLGNNWGDQCPQKGSHGIEMFGVAVEKRVL